MKTAAVVTNLSGGAFLVRDGRESLLETGAELLVTDGVRTGLDGRAELRFADGTEVALGVMSQVEIRDFAYDPSGQAESSFAMHMMEGVVRTVTGEVVKLNPEGFSLSTPLGTAGIRGTTVVAQIFPTHVVFMVTDMGHGKHVVINSVFGGDLTIYQPGTGAEITLTGQEKINLLDAIPDDMRDALQQLLDGVYDDERSSRDDPFILMGDAEFLAALGVADVGRGVGLLSVDDAEIIVNLLQELGVDQPEFFLTAEFTDDDEWSTIYWEGTPGNDTYVGIMNRHYHLRALEGNDTLVTFNGNDTVYGGNGSRDKIMKVADLMETGAVIYGGDTALASPASLDNDSITVRGPGASDPAPDAANADLYWANENEWTPTAMTGGEIYGSAGSLSGYNNNGGANVITLYGNMSGGAIYGKAGTVDSCSFADGSVIDIAGAAKGGGNMSGGAIYGDAHTVVDSATGGDIVTVQGNMSGGAIYGDAHTITNSSGGGDEIVLAGDLTASGVIYGDGYSMDATSAGGDDTIQVINMGGGTIYGDAYNLDGGQAGADAISLGGAMSGGTIYTDAATGSYTAAGGANTVSIHTMKGGNVYGGLGDDTVDVKYFHGGTFNLGEGSDTLSITNWMPGTLNIGAVEGSLTLLSVSTTAATIEVGTLHSGGSLTLGTGLDNKKVVIEDQQGGTVNLGTGLHNSLEIKAISGAVVVNAAEFEVAELKAGAGITSTVSAANMTVGGMGAASAITTGAVADTITVTGNTGAGSRINAGDGLNEIEVQGVMSGGQIFTGTGNDKITLNTLGGDNLINAGTGENQIAIDSLNATAQSNISIQGGGKNAIAISEWNGPGTSTLDYSDSDSNGSELTITSVTAGGTLVGVGLDQNKVSITDFAAGAGTLTLGGSGTKYEVYITNATSGTLMGGEKGSGDNITVLASMGKDMTIVGGKGIDNVTILNTLEGTIAGDFIEMGEDTANIMGRDIIYIQASMGSQAIIYGDAKSISGITENGDPVSNYMSDLIGIAGITSDAKGVIYGDAETIGTISMGESTLMLESEGFMADDIGIDGDLYGAIYGDAASIQSIVFRQAVNGSMPVRFMADTIGIKGAMKDGSAIYGDSEVVNWDYQTDDGVGNLTPVTPDDPTWHAAFGCDSISVGGMQGGAIYGGFGNDTITVSNNTLKAGMSGGAIDGGDGKDQIAVYGAMSGGTIDGGDGNDVIEVYGAMSGGAMSGGAGNDQIRVYGAMTDGTIDGGDGDDSISVTSMDDGQATIVDGSPITPCGAIAAGDGNDKVFVTTLSGNHGTIIDLGAGNDSVSIDSVANGTRATIILGDGNTPSEWNVIDLDGFTGDVLDNGEATLDVYGFTGTSQVFFSAIDRNQATLTKVGGTWQATVDFYLNGGGQQGSITLILHDYNGPNPEEQFHKSGALNTGDHHGSLADEVGIELTVGADLVDGTSVGLPFMTVDFGNRTTLPDQGDGMQDTLSLNSGFTLTQNSVITLNNFDLGGNGVHDTIRYNSDDWEAPEWKEISPDKYGFSLEHKGTGGYTLGFVLGNGSWDASMGSLFVDTRPPDAG